MSNVLLTQRLHVDLLRVTSAVCRPCWDPSAGLSRIGHPPASRL